MIFQSLIKKIEQDKQQQIDKGRLAMLSGMNGYDIMNNEKIMVLNANLILLKTLQKEVEEVLDKMFICNTLRLYREGDVYEIESEIKKQIKSSLENIGVKE